MSFQHVTDETLSGYLAGELTAREKYDADSHFTICPACAAKLEKQREFEKKIAAAYNSSFPLYLSPDARNAVSGEVSAGFAVDTKAPLWQKKIVISFLIQAASVILVAAAVAAMILTQPRDNKTEVETVPAAPAVKNVQPEKLPEPVKTDSPAVTQTVVKVKAPSPVVPAPAPVKEKQVETAVVKTVVPPPAPVAKVEPPAPPVKPVETKPVETKVAETSEALLQAHSALIKLFRIDQIAIRKKSDQNFLLQGVKSPFADDLYVIYAASGVPEKDAKRQVELILAPIGKMPFVISHPAGQNDVCIMAFRTRTLPGEIGKLESAITEDGEKNINTLLFEKDMIAADFNAAPEQVRLAAILQAASVPRLILKRDIRAKVIAELENLLAGGYAADPQVKAMLEQLKKVR